MTVSGLNGAGAPAGASGAEPPTYVVRPGDTLSGIASAHGVSLEALQAANPQILHPDLIRAGQTLHLPETQAHPAAAPAQGSYTVKAGDTLSGIGARFGVDWRIVAQTNGITDPSKLQVGSKLTITSGAGARPATAGATHPAGAATTHPAGAAAPAAGAFTPGALSARYESNGSPGTVSTGAGDAGGVSYGAYQITTANARSFVAHEGAAFPELQGKTPGTAAFNTAWRAAAARDPAGFLSAQHDYISRTHYAPQTSLIQRDTGLDVGARSHALQDVVWSTAVQHGGGTDIVAGAVRGVEARGVSPDDAGFDSQVIDAVYAERGRTGANGQLAHFSHNSAAVQRGVAARFVSERGQAQAELAAENR